MSRIGKQPINIPAGVTIAINGPTISVKGPLGELTTTLLDGMKIDFTNNVLTVIADNFREDKKIASFFGLQRTLLNNMVEGVSKGYEKELEILGVGYRATQQSGDIMFQLGYSHNIVFPAPKGIVLEVLEATKLKVKGINKQLVGQIAANIRKLRPPEPYKGKGIRYKNENVRKKAGKTGK